MECKHCGQLIQLNVGRRRHPADRVAARNGFCNWDCFGQYMDNEQYIAEQEAAING